MIDEKDLPKENTDKHLFYEDPNDERYSPSCHMTEGRHLGIQVGGTVVGMSLRDWMELFSKSTKLHQYINNALMVEKAKLGHAKDQADTKYIEGRISVLEHIINEQ